MAWKTKATKDSTDISVDDLARMDEYLAANWPEARKKVLTILSRTLNIKLDLATMAAKKLAKMVGGQPMKKAADLTYSLTKEGTFRVWKWRFKNNNPFHPVVATEQYCEYMLWHHKNYKRPAYVYNLSATIDEAFDKLSDPRR